ncbi:MAG: hypothetical protein ACO1OF_02400 [Adhaeribacter sp.]
MAFAMYRRLNAIVQQHGNKPVRGALASLVGIEDVWLAVFVYGVRLSACPSLSNLSTLRPERISSTIFLFSKDKNISFALRPKPLLFKALHTWFKAVSGVYFLLFFT